MVANTKFDALVRRPVRGVNISILHRGVVFSKLSFPNQEIGGWGRRTHSVSALLVLPVLLFSRNEVLTIVDAHQMSRVNFRFFGWPTILGLSSIGGVVFSNIVEK